MRVWTTYRIKDVAKLISEKSNDFTLPYIALDNIVSWDASFVPSDSSSDGNSNECEAGDVLFGKLRPYLAKGFIPSEKSICSPEFLVLRPYDITHNRFLLYYLLSKSFISYIRNQVAGVKMPRTSWTQISGYHITMPELAEQKTIADYLDKECGKIDKKVELLEQKADAYSRLRRSIINRAATRGLNPDVPLKPSGIPWIKLIPEHWDIKRGKSLFQEIYREVRPEDGTVTCFRDGEVTLRTNRRTTGFTESEKEIGYHGVRIGDLVIHQMDAFAGSIGISDSDGKCSPICMVCRPIQEEQVNLKYYCQLLRVMAHRGFIQSLAKGIRERTTDFRYKTFVSLHFPVPPIDEQREIATYLDDKCGKIDDIIGKIEMQVERLKELKRSLINEVVTGQRAITTE